MEQDHPRKPGLTEFLRAAKSGFRQTAENAFVHFVLPGRQRKVLEQVRAKSSGGEAVRVAFLVSETSKWKVQPIYDAMKADPRFSAFAVVVPLSVVRKSGLETVLADLETIRGFLERRGVAAIDGIDRKTGLPIPPEMFNPDVLWYEQPWSLPPGFGPDEVSKVCLTLYQPYFVPNYETPVDEVCRLAFHRELFAMFAAGATLADEYRKANSRTASAVEIVPSGHSAFAEIAAASRSREAENLVIYAPHWSFRHPGNPNKENYSTFLETGRTVLEYAEAHPEIKWAYKPHPRLEWSLVSSGAMDAAAVRDYRNAWRRVGEICDDGNYHGLFARAKAIVTDCGSFLTEFAATGKPVIHLVPTPESVKPAKYMEPLFDSFYRVRNEEELKAAFSSVLERGEDPKRDERLSCMASLGFSESDAAGNVMKWMEKAFLAEAFQDAGPDGRDSRQSACRKS